MTYKPVTSRLPRRGFTIRHDDGTHDSYAQDPDTGEWMTTTEWFERNPPCTCRAVTKRVEITHPRVSYIGIRDDIVDIDRSSCRLHAHDA